MDVNSAGISNLASIRQALGIATLRKAMNQDAVSISNLIEGMEKANAKTMEQSVSPHIGSNIDVSA
jgi:hypothetical protein